MAKTKMPMVSLIIALTVLVLSKFSYGHSDHSEIPFKCPNLTKSTKNALLEGGQSFNEP